MEIMAKEKWIIYRDFQFEFLTMVRLRFERLFPHPMLIIEFLIELYKLFSFLNNCIFSSIFYSQFFGIQIAVKKYILIVHFLTIFRFRFNNKGTRTKRAIF
jgi:hypothetical protein